LSLPAILLLLGILCLGVAAWVRHSLAIKRSDVQPLALRRVPSGPASDADRIWFSIDSLRETSPHLSAQETLNHRQRGGLILVATGLLIFLLVSWRGLFITVLALITVIYLASMGFRLRLYLLSLNGRGIFRISDGEARAFPDDRLPSYSVLVPAFHEPEVCERLIANLRRLEYPRDRMEILLLLEESDTETIDAANQAVGDSDDVRLVIVPNRPPQTKPKALNYGVTHSRGSIITIYDAEDRPDPLQLRKAAIALTRAPAEVACVQSQLNFFNPGQNLITRWFAIEYHMWFSQLLPGLAQLDAPIPLGGTSNHFRRDALMELNAWDPFNVTEDADLGVRMHRAGYRSGVIDSVTMEEANSDFVNWVKQRSRWYKGYAQTLLVHLRHPGALYREIGLRETILFVLFVGGTPALAVLNPIFWIITAAWWTMHPVLITQLMPTAVYFGGLVCWALGNFLFAYTCLLSVRESRDPKVWLAAITMPVYWVMMALAGIKALLQLVTAPSYWEKTTHGLDEVAVGSAAQPR
jgi:glycosyltransferase XagB